MNIKNIFQKSVKNIDDFRELAENKVAQGLRKIRGNKSVDSAEVVISNAVMTAIELYLGKTIPSDVKTKINEGVVKGCDIANEVVVNQLEKP